MSRSRTKGRYASLAALFCALAMAGCTLPPSGIDPTGQGLIAQPPPGPQNCKPPRFVDYPAKPPCGSDAGVILNPSSLVAPVGSEVILLGGVVGRDQCLRTNRRLDWSITQGSVGHFVAVGNNGWGDRLAGDFTDYRKVDNTYAIGSTSHSGLRLHHGTPNADDDVYVLAGQGWASLTSPIEGTSNVTVYSPDVYPWSARLQSAVVHWIDCQWRCPAPAHRPAASRHALTTSVERQSDHSPCVGWLVRYSITGGPPAGFDPAGASIVDVPTDSNGLATAEIFQKHIGPGLNTIEVYVIRPGEIQGAGGKQLVMRAGATSVEWTAAALSVAKSGPASGGVGTTLAYSTVVSNPGDQPANDVVVTEDIPDGVTFQTSVPPAEVAGRRLTWRLGALAPGETKTLEVHYRADRAGSVTFCANVHADRALRASDCATTTIGGAAGVELKVTGPTEVAVGGVARFDIEIVNRTQAPVADLIVTDRYQDGLDPEIEGPISKHIQTAIAPGSSYYTFVNFRVTKPGQWCHTVEIKQKGGAVLASERACVTATAAAAPPGPEAPPPGVRPDLLGPAAPRPDVSVTKTGPAQATVGQEVKFVIDVVNNGSSPLTGVKVIDRCDDGLTATQASKFHTAEPDGTLSWTIETLRPGDRQQYEVVCRCEKPMLKTCNRVSVTTREGASGEAEACLEIRAAGAAIPGGLFPSAMMSAKRPATESGPTIGPAAGADKLGLAIRHLAADYTAGAVAAYRIEVTNIGTQLDRWISLEIALPDGMTANPLGTKGPETSRAQIAGRTVRFDKVPELKPGQTLTYDLRVQTRQAGPMRVQAQATSHEQPRPIAAEKTTVVKEE